ncbi:MAG: ABC transporter ATP-binding protein [Rhodospirillales bacterium]|nr:ABC transporter ATP-binding protein [Rhodospirillales bacterium]
MLDVVDLHRRFGGVTALSGVSIAVRQGSITALIGPNGAGKTTAFATIAGFHRPDRGQMRFLGRDITGWRPERIARLGLVRTFQIVQPFGRLSVRDNIAVGAHLHLARRASALTEAEAVARRLGLAADLDKPADTLPIAGRKRLELARALATRPRMLLLDEVMAGLNPAEVAALMPVIREIRDGGVTLLMIEHVMQAVAELAERCIVLAEGRVIATGTVAEVARDPVVVDAYLGEGAAARLADHHAA